MAKKNTSSRNKPKATAQDAETPVEAAPEAGPAPAAEDASATAPKPEPEEIIDAEIVEETAPESLEETAEEAAPPETASPETAQDAPSEPAPDEPKDEEPPQDAPEPVTPTAEATPEPQPAPVEPAPKKGGMGGAILGGIIAACLGGGAVYFAGGQFGPAEDDGLKTTVESQAAEIAELKTALADALAASAAQSETLTEGLASATGTNTEQSAAIAALEQALADTSVAEGVSANASELGSLADLLTETRSRLGELEVQPIPEAELPKEVTEAFERQLADILATIEGRFADMQTEQDAVVAGLEAEIQAQMAELKTAQEEAAVIEKAAFEAAKAADARAAIARITVALDSGTGFADELAQLEENGAITAPEALSAVAADGAATLASLQAGFPPLARQVLDEVSREAADDGSISPLAALLATQLGARSLEPREGSDPDAVLSRAEAAIKAGDVETTLTEIAALPERGQEIFAGWVESANALDAARAAAAAISEQLNN